MDEAHGNAMLSRPLVASAGDGPMETILIILEQNVRSQQRPPQPVPYYHILSRGVLTVLAK
jgi:hypothetical protein